MKACENILCNSDLTIEQKQLFATLYCSGRKDTTKAVLLSLFLGALGIDRFYVGSFVMGGLKLAAGLLAALAGIEIIFLINRYGAGRAYNADPTYMSLSIAMLVVLGLLVVIDWFVIRGLVEDANDEFALKCKAFAQMAIQEKARSEG